MCCLSLRRLATAPERPRRRSLCSASTAWIRASSSDTGPISRTFGRLSEQGSYTHLGTTTPPQSPVAWSTFITGLTPAEHGIFDFVHRDPVTLAPFLSMTRTEEPRHTLSVRDWRFPLSSARIVSLRKGVPFWKLLADAGIPVTMVRMPTNYPPVEAGHAIAGMGTPDLNGTQGTFTLFTNDPEELSRSVNGGRIEKVQVENGRAVLRIEGPPNTFRKEGPPATVDVIADVMHASRTPASLSKIGWPLFARASGRSG